MIVAIDGPAGTGKGTVSKLISERLDFLCIDTGAMYRAVTLNFIRNNVNIADLGDVLSILDKTKIDIEFDVSGQKTFLNGEDVSDKIRTPEINSLVSQISSIREIREKLVVLQRKFALDNDIVMEGRDITTVVFPNADIKIYLTAEQSERANRRYKEMMEKGIETTYDEVYESIKKRDENDKNKEYGALKVADDAVVVDSTEMSIEEVYEKLKEIIFSKLNWSRKEEEKWDGIEML